LIEQEYGMTDFHTIATGVVVSFVGLLRNIGDAGAMLTV